MHVVCVLCAAQAPKRVGIVATTKMLDGHTDSGPSACRQLRLQQRGRESRPHGCSTTGVHTGQCMHKQRNQHGHVGPHKPRRACNCKAHFLTALHGHQSNTCPPGPPDLLQSHVLSLRMHGNATPSRRTGPTNEPRLEIPSGPLCQSAASRRELPELSPSSV